MMSNIEEIPSSVETALALFTVFGVIIIGLFAPVLIGLLRPGRKGNMRTRREIVCPDISVSEASATCRERLLHEGFEIKDQDPLCIHASRGSSTAYPTLSLTAHTHYSKPLTAVICFNQQDNGVLVRITLWMNDYVFNDTGEGNYIDLLLDRLLFGDLDAKTQQSVPNLTYNSQVAFFMSILMLPFSLTVPFLPAQTALGIFVCLLLDCFVVIGLSLFGIIECLFRPKEITGMGKSGLAILVALSAIIIAVGLLALLHGRELIKP